MCSTDPAYHCHNHCQMLQGHVVPTLSFCNPLHLSTAISLHDPIHLPLHLLTIVMLFLFQDNTIPCLTVISFCFTLLTNKITLLTESVCDEFGNYSLPKDAPPPPPCPTPTHDDWTPYKNRVEFETAEFLYCKTQMSTDNIDTLTNLWAATLLLHDDFPPFANHSDLYETIDSIKTLHSPTIPCGLLVHS